MFTYVSTVGPSLGLPHPIVGISSESYMVHRINIVQDFSPCYSVFILTVQTLSPEISLYFISKCYLKCSLLVRGDNNNF